MNHSYSPHAHTHTHSHAHAYPTHPYSPIARNVRYPTGLLESTKWAAETAPPHERFSSFLQRRTHYSNDARSHLHTPTHTHSREMRRPWTFTWSLLFLTLSVLGKSLGESAANGPSHGPRASLAPPSDPSSSRGSSMDLRPGRPTLQASIDQLGASFYPYPRAASYASAEYYPSDASAAKPTNDLAPKHASTSTPSTTYPTTYPTKTTTTMICPSLKNRFYYRFPNGVEFTPLQGVGSLQVPQQLLHYRDHVALTLVRMEPRRRWWHRLATFLSGGGRGGAVGRKSSTTRLRVWLQDAQSSTTSNGEDFQDGVLLNQVVNDGFHKYQADTKKQQLASHKEQHQHNDDDGIAKLQQWLRYWDSTHVPDHASPGPFHLQAQQAKLLFAADCPVPDGYRIAVYPMVLHLDPARFQAPRHGYYRLAIDAEMGTARGSWWRNLFRRRGSGGSGGSGHPDTHGWTTSSRPRHHQRFTSQWFGIRVPESMERDMLVKVQAETDLRLLRQWLLAIPTPVFLLDRFIQEMVRQEKPDRLEAVLYKFQVKCKESVEFPAVAQYCRRLPQAWLTGLT